MPSYRQYSFAFKRQLVDEHLSGTSVHALLRRFDVGWALIRLWARKAESGGLDDETGSSILHRCFLLWQNKAPHPA
jgi:transposase